MPSSSSSHRASPAVLFQNVRVYDGASAEVSAPCNVSIEGNRIAKVTTGAIASNGATQVISGGGRVLMPGLIDAHWHSLLCALPPAELLDVDLAYATLVAGREAGRTLMRGFTTIRDLGGPSFALKRVIDEGKIAGPRIYPSGAIISQTSGHGDFRPKNMLPSPLHRCIGPSDAAGMTAVADGVPAVLRAVREQLMLGATQIKLCAGGGVASAHDPLDVTQFSEDELRAAATAAADWGTYVTVHAYSPRGIRRSIAAGVRCIEHGHLLDEETAALMSDKGTWLCMQPFLDDEDASPMSPPQRQKYMLVVEGTDTTYRLARKHRLKLSFGTDMLFNPKGLDRQGAQLVKLSRWFETPDVLRLATSGNASLLAMCGERNPYPAKLGVVEEGALADVLLVDGNPLEKLSLLAEPEKNLLVIVKDGVVYKNRLH